MQKTTAPPITHVTETITPTLAEKYLKQNVHNRPIREWHVKELENDMLNDNFPENGENGITFDWNHNLAGGQHTLAAIIRSGRTIQLRVTRGIDPAARVTMNDTVKQRFSDDLTITGVRNATFYEPLLKKILYWDNIAADHKDTGGLAGLRSYRVSRATLSDAWPKYATQINDTMNVTSKWVNDWPANRGVMHFAYWLLIHRTGCNNTTVSDFFEKIKFGSSDEDDKMLFSRLRKKFLESPDATFQVFFLIRTWNAWCKNESLTKLQPPRDAIDPVTRKIHFTDPFPRVYKAR
jgi:hypothetical protein